MASREIEPEAARQDVPATAEPSNGSLAAPDKSEERFRWLVENIREVVVEDDAEGRIVYANDRFLDLFGYGREECSGMALEGYLAPEWRRLVRERHQKRMLGLEAAECFECEGLRKDGSRLWLRVQVSPIIENGRITGSRAALHDFTEHRQAEQLQSALYRIVEVARSSEDLPKLYASIHGIVGELIYAKNCYIALFDRETDLVSFPYFVDEKDLAMPPHRFGRGLTEYILRTGQPLVATNERIEELVRLGELRRVGAASLDWIGVPLKRGEQTYGAFVLQSYEPIKQYGENEKELLMIVSQQIAAAIESKRSEAAISASETKFQAVAETAPTLILVSDGDRIFYANPAAELATGYTREELLSMNPWSIITAPGARATLERRALARMQGVPSGGRHECPILTKSGEERWLGIQASIIEFGGKQALLTTAEDVTEYKRAEQLRSALYRISEQAALAQNLPQFFSSLHAIVGELMFAANFYIALYDPVSETLSFPYFVDEEDDTPVRKRLGKGLTEYVLRTGEPLLASPEVFEDLIARGEVEAIGAPSVDWLGVPLKGGASSIGALVVQSYSESIRFNEKHKDILTFVSQNIAGAIERKRGAEALRNSEERYRRQVEGAVCGIYRASVEDRFLEVNPALIAMLGYESAQEVLGLCLSRDVYVNPADWTSMLESCRQQDHIGSVEVRWKRKQHSVFTARLSGRVVREVNGQISSVEMIVEDVSERWLLEQQLHQSQKMEAVGQLAGGVAHDFNNLLTIIRGYNELMQEQIAPGDPWWGPTEEIRKATERSAGLVRQLLAFSRKQVLELRVLDLNAVINDLAKMLRRLLGEDVVLSTKLGHAVGRIKADPGQIEQVLMNLAVNARDAMAKGGRLTIHTANFEVAGAHAEAETGVKAGHYVLLEVSDTGVGMDEETIGRIFEPFFTTKAPGRGTGLGLSTVYGIVKQSGGFIYVESKPGAGATFKVYLPRGDEAETELAGDTNEPQEGRGTETILVVEDEEGLRGLVTEVLRRHGYNVIATGLGEECLQRCMAYRSGIDMLFTDVVLPGINGRELAERVKALRPNVKVLYMSGHTTDAILRRGIESQQAAFLEKPFRVDVMVRKVREVLDSPEP